MKRLSGVIVLILFCVTAAIPQQEWQGLVARGGSADFPGEGYYAASNSFARNSVVTVTNPLTGKSIRVVITNTLSDSGLFMTLSTDAAKALGLEGSRPVSMRAQPVIIPGLADQSIGSELPFNPDPDINPAASAGDPNAFVFNGGASAQNIRPEQASPSPSPVVVVQASPSPEPLPSPTPVVAVVSPSPAIAVISPSPSPSDLDLGGSALIGDTGRGNDTVAANAANTAGSTPSPSPGSTPRLNNGTTQQVAAASPASSGVAASGSNQTANPANANPIEDRGLSANNLSSSPSAAPGTGTLNQGQAGTSANIAGTTPSPSPSPAVVTANTQNALPGTGNNSITGSPLASPAPSTVTGPQTGIAASINDLRAQPRQGIGSGIAGSGTPATAPGSATLSRPSPSPSVAVLASPSPSPSPVGRVAQGVNDVNTPGLNQTQTGNLPGTSPVAQPAGPGTGMTNGVQSLGDGTRVRPNTGDIARPEHLFNPPKNGAASPASVPGTPSLASPALRTPAASPGVTPAPSAAPAQSLLNQQLAALNNRGGQDALFIEPNGNGLSPSLAGASPSGSPLTQAALPQANVPGAATPESPFAGRSPSAAALANNGLPQVTAPGALTPESSIGTGFPPKSGLSTGIAAGLPNARLPNQSLPEASNPWLEGGSSPYAANGLSLPLAQAVPNELPQAALRGAEPGITAMPSSGDLPLVAVDTSRSTADKGIAGTSPAAGSVAGGTLPSPREGAAATVEDPMSALRPGKTIVSLEPADYRPPVLKTPSADGVKSIGPGTSDVSGTLAEARVPGKSTADPSISGAVSQPGAIGADLASPRNPSGPESALSATSPNLSAIEARLAEAQVRGNAVPDASIAGTAGANGSPATGNLSSPRTPAGADPVLGTGTPGQEPVSGNLSSPRTPGSADPLLGTGTPGQEPVTGTLAQAQVRNGGTADNGLVLGTPSGTNPNVTLADPTASQVDTLNGTKTPANGNVVVGINAAEPRTPGTASNNTGNQTGTVATNQSNALLNSDEAWAVSNLPIVKTLQKEQYYLQVGAFANPRSAKRAIDEVALSYPTLVLPEKSNAGSQVYKVYIGPLSEDEKGLILYWLRAKGYRDAFVRKGQP